MRMILRWFGRDDDHVSLEYIVQIPGVSGIAGALFDVPVGEEWPLDKIRALADDVKKSGLKFEVVESVNVHEDIKLGLPTRDQYIDNYIQTIRNLASVGVKVICYNFMPVFDWLRSDLAMQLEDGSYAMAYHEDKIIDTNPVEIIERFREGSQGFSLPGWEPERLAELKQVLSQYAAVDEDKLFDNLKYFLERLKPVCDETGVKMAIHPDDPPWSVFGLPRIITNRDNLARVLSLVDSPHNGLTLCTGSLGANLDNDLPAMIREFGKRGRIHFVHVRNLKIYAPGDFHETSHLSSDGSLDMFEVMKALYEIGFDGYLRPDHGRMIWGEKGRPGYGLYDRALGAMYLTGIWEALSKMV